MISLLNSLSFGLVKHITPRLSVIPRSYSVSNYINCRQERMKHTWQGNNSDTFENTSIDVRYKDLEISQPRLDDLYWRESDKRNRNYAQTWKESAEIKDKKTPPKQQFDKCSVDITEKRVEGSVAANYSQTACSTTGDLSSLLFCLKGTEQERKYGKFDLGFKKKPIPAVKVEVAKVGARKLSDAKRRSTKHPSFSECKNLRGYCDKNAKDMCLGNQSVSAMYEAWQNKVSYKKKINVIS